MTGKSRNLELPHLTRNNFDPKLSICSSAFCAVSTIEKTEVLFSKWRKLAPTATQLYRYPSLKKDLLVCIDMIFKNKTRFANCQMAIN